MKFQLFIRKIIILKEWIDYKLRWDPKIYGGVEVLYVPSLNIWVTDLFALIADYKNNWKNLNKYY